MDRTKDPKSLIQLYHQLLALQERTGKYLQSIGYDPDVLEVHRRLLRHLRTRSDDQVLEILRAAPRSVPAVGTQEAFRQRIPDRVIEGWTLDDVREHLTKPLTRQELDQIAAVRFGVTKGALSVLRSRNALLQKLLTLIDNESAHSAIARVIRRNKDKLPG